MPLGKKLFVCDKCGLIVDRDVNAFANIAQESNRVAAKQADTVNVCGGGRLWPSPQGDDETGPDETETVCVRRRLVAREGRR
jgi:transposase